MKLLFCVLMSLLVQSQADFDKIPEKVREALTGEKPPQIEICLAPGIYFYEDKFLDLQDIDAAETALRICGEDAVLVASDGGDRSYSLDKGYVDLQALRHVDIRTEMRPARFWPLWALFKKETYHLLCRERPLPADTLAQTTILLSQWYVGAHYPVEKITRGQIIFRRDKKYETRMLSELRFGRCRPRYMLCTPPKDTTLYPCSAPRFLRVTHAKLQSLSLEGLRFLGNGDKASNWLILLSGLAADSVKVHGCTFEGIRSGAIRIEETDRFLLQDNLFTRCYRTCVYVQSDAHDAHILHNRFINNGLELSSAAIVNCKGAHFLIKDNYFEDFSYSAIGLGHHYLEPQVEDGLSGIVEDNEICMSEAFRSGVPRVLIDSGAIYVWTQNNDLTIRRNYIHDIAGAHGNRGILCDDGAYNVKIYGNRIVRIKGSYCIDHRMFRRVAWRKGSHVTRPNVSNVIRDNVLDGRCRIHVRRSDPDSYFGDNIWL